ncbi:MAG TPA: hypothetical protein VGL80_09810 [Pseudonocardiaceae bacterium]|jgi:hypothetical protein
MADRSTQPGAGFAVRDEALAAYVRDASRIATDLDGFQHREIPTARDLPADAFGPLAKTCGLTTAVVRFCGRATDAAHAIGSTVHGIESGVDEARKHYKATEHAVAERLAAHHSGHQGAKA